MIQNYNSSFLYPNSVLQDAREAHLEHSCAPLVSPLEAVDVFKESPELGAGIGGNQQESDGISRNHQESTGIGLKRPETA